MGKHRNGRTLRRAGLVGLATASLVAVSMGAWADTLGLDGDTATPGGSPAAFSTALDNCSGTVSGTISINYNGNASQHFAAGEALAITFYPPAGSGITAQTVDATPNMASPWDSTSPDYVIDFTTAISPTTVDGTYQVGVQVAGASYAVGRDAGSGRPQYAVNVACSNSGGGTGQGTNSPPTADAGGPYTGNEGSAISLSGATASDADADPLTYSWGYADANGVTNPAGSSCSFSNAAILNPTITCNDNGEWTLTLTVNDGHNPSVSDTADLQVSNVAPTIGTISGPTTVLMGISYTYSIAKGGLTGTTDPSSNDTSAGFWYKWDGNDYPAGFPTSGADNNTFSTSFSSCGTSNTVSAYAKDKDNGESSQATLSTISAYDANFRQPITQGVYNAVPKGYVLPVKVFVGCGSTFNSSLTPRIQLYNGDVDPSTDPSDPTIALSTTSASSADTTGIMRLADGQYIYNLQVPAAATVGQQYTVAVWPFGSASPYANSVLKVLLRIRK